MRPAAVYRFEELRGGRAGSTCANHKLFSIFFVFLAACISLYGDYAFAFPNLRDHGNDSLDSIASHKMDERIPTVTPTRDPQFEFVDKFSFEKEDLLDSVGAASDTFDAFDYQGWISGELLTMLSADSNNSTLKPSNYPTESPTSAPTRFLTVLSNTTLYIIGGCVGGLALTMLFCYYCCCQPSANKRKIATLLKFDDQLRK
jgi:hypothetical protein